MIMRIAGILWVGLVACALASTVWWIVFRPGQNEFELLPLFILGLPWSILTAAWLQYLPVWLDVVILSLCGFANVAILLRASGGGK
jgi:hypothetical protein